jgi:hypothetical protein
LKYQLAGRRQSLDDVGLDAAAVFDFAAAVRVKDLSIRVCHLLTQPRSYEPLVRCVYVYPFVVGAELADATHRVRLYIYIDVLRSMYKIYHTQTQAQAQA